MLGRHVPVLVITVLIFTWMSSAVLFPVQADGDWEDGTFTNTTVSDDALVLDGDSDTGTYRSDDFDAGDTYSWEQVVVDADLNGGDVGLSIETSNDGFSSVTERILYSVEDGTSSISLSEFEDSRYIRFNYTLTRGDATPRIEATNLSVEENTTFVVRQDTCLDGEEALFSMSDRVNAHAGDPGYWEYQVCAGGIDRSAYRSVCTDVESPVLSFFDSEETFIHLSTDSDQFNQQLCTGELSIGIRDECPDTTKAIVSIYDLPESHVATPGVYGHHLCGAIFTDVSLMMEFHHGEDDTVRMHDDDDPGTGMYEYPVGLDSGFISAEAASLVAGIVSGEYTRTTGIEYREDGDDHVFRMMQDRNVDVSFFIPYAEGTSRSLENRIGLIEDGEFLSQINPNFGMRLAEEMLIQLTLQFTNIDLVTDMVLSSGSHRLIIENIGETGDGEPRVRINATAP